MTDISDWHGQTDPNKEMGTKVRLCNIFRKPEQTASAILAEVNQLSPSDIEDFKRWFNEAGYPTK